MEDDNTAQAGPSGQNNSAVERSSGERRGTAGRILRISGIRRRHAQVNNTPDEFDRRVQQQHCGRINYLDEWRKSNFVGDYISETITIVMLPGIHLFPGQNFCHKFNSPASICLIRNMVKNNWTLGVINGNHSGIVFIADSVCIGTTVTVRSFTEEKSGNGGPIMKLETKSRRRFRLLEYTRAVDAFIVGIVKFLPDLRLCGPGADARLHSLNKFQIHPPNWNPEPKPCPSSYLPRQSHKYNRFDFANYTPFPAFVYKQYDHLFLMKQILYELRNWTSILKVGNFPRTPREFSFWLSALLPMDNDQRNILLTMDEVTERLRHLLKLLKESSIYCCKVCSNVIAKLKDVFSMAEHDPQGDYVNSNSKMLESVITFYNAKEMLPGRTLRSRIWFEGYASTIQDCSQCLTALGWRITAIDKTLKPQVFWALLRSDIQIKMIQPE